MRNRAQQGVPRLYIQPIYLDDLLQSLSRCEEGAMLGCLFVGLLAYAFDITLVSPTDCGLQGHLISVVRYARENGLTFKSMEVFFWKLTCTHNFIGSSCLMIMFSRTSQKQLIQVLSLI